MLDITFIRNNRQDVEKNARNRNAAINVDTILKLDDQRRDLQKQIDELRHTIHSASKHKPAPNEQEKLRRIGDMIAKSESTLKRITQLLHDKLSLVPNMLASDVPIGSGEDDNIEIKAWTPAKGYVPQIQLGKKDISRIAMPSFSFPAKDHVDLGRSLNIIDIDQSAKVSGSRFAYLKNEAVLLQFALFELLKDKLLKEGFIPMIVPLLVRQRTLYGSSHLPEEEDQVYKIVNKNVEDNQDLYLVGSSEPPLFAYFMDKTLAEKDLPQKMFAFTSCFRSEVGSWGKDVRGIKRVHQFDKMEMDTITTPEKSAEMQEYLLSINEWILQQLQLPYHIILMCSADSGYAAASKKYDVEVWLPSQHAFMEVMSDTNATDYQARRFNIKYIPRSPSQTARTSTDSNTEGASLPKLSSSHTKRYVHTVNDTGCAMGRMIIAILDNYQRSDGSVTIPRVLQKYLGKDVIRPLNH